MKRNFFKEERGDTNIVSLIILITVAVVAAVIFKPYIGSLVQWILGLFS